MLHFELVTPEKLVRSEDVYMVVVPGTEGDFGVLEHHAPFMSTIRDGALSIYHTEKGEPEILAIQGGFAEVSKSGLTVLAERTGDAVVHIDPATAATATATPNKARLPDR
jgi:F-type H+-transporting ATPase subunit epsilon